MSVKICNFTVLSAPVFDVHLLIHETPSDVTSKVFKVCLCSPKGETYSRRFVHPSVQYLVQQITLKLLLAFKWNLDYR